MRDVGGGEGAKGRGGGFVLYPFFFLSCVEKRKKSFIIPSSFLLNYQRTIPPPALKITDLKSHSLRPISLP